MFKAYNFAVCYFKTMMVPATSKPVAIARGNVGGNVLPSCAVAMYHLRIRGFHFAYNSK